MPCDPELLNQINFFELLDDDDRRALAEVIDRLDLEEGSTLFEVGDPGCELYVVQAGSIELYVRDTTGQKIVVHTARTGDMFGELALLDDEPRSATAVAAEPTSLLVLDRGDLSLLFQKQPDAALAMLASMSAMTRKADRLLQTRVSRNANEEAAEQLGVLQKIADWLAWFSGSMPFLLSHTVWFAVWISLNTFILPKDPATGERGFDPFPFGLLTMIVSLEAIFLACFVLISQNRQAQKDKVRADIEYEVNIKAELEVAHLHIKTDRIQETMLARFNRLEQALGRTSSAAIEGDGSGARR
jgi:CRP/FNR family cyclic AMP-dependent transcriptional regulator